ncbi:uncharacterized protein LOC131061789 [Cryptomeria japonica]|uniref:uncharacterized protein LOC131061789 n=1 Tax=Cryptomeria japonica TaxID=3369 RepID=UPI0025AC92E9|nr:uncharacterized protein LOC131061789 [Cryptomeria japonica]XP_057851603.1 uncharacterized protein LOC131061789 [Cryptomeria japonica]XP_057851604.1 uncharacterized protein LOC131061789 [Cryptomeria japonica]
MDSMLQLPLREQGKKEEEEENIKPNGNIPASALVYLNPQYWDERFVEEDHYEWFKEYSHFRHLVSLHVKSSDKVLELGCGSSQMCEGLYWDGITQITCIDISSVAVEKMQKRLTAKGLHGVQILVTDMLSLPFESESFDVVIEKGTMDVLLVDSGDPWNPKPETVNKVNAMLRGVHRVLRPEGIFISISFGQPHFRRPLFETSEFTWSMQWSTFGDGFHYFFYTLKKGSRNPNFSHDKKEDKLVMNGISLYQEHLDSENYLFNSNLVDDEELES